MDIKFNSIIKSEWVPHYLPATFNVFMNIGWGIFWQTKSVDKKHFFNKKHAKKLFGSKLTFQFLSGGYLSRLQPREIWYSFSYCDVSYLKLTFQLLSYASTNYKYERIEIFLVPYVYILWNNKPKSYYHPKLHGLSVDLVLVALENGVYQNIIKTN